MYDNEHEHDEHCECHDNDHDHEHDEHCGCHDHHDHEHRHEHDEHCECHEHHDHEHHHEHDEHCECHEHHDHEHHHDDDCECGCHDHEHENHHHEGGVEIHIHEAAVAASFEKKTSRSSEDVIEALKPLMAELKATAKANHGIIGHIKASVTGAESTTMLSLTKDIIDQKVEPTALCTLCFAAIIFNIDEEVLEEAVEKIYDEF